jgi:hypothetical protein
VTQAQLQMVIGQFNSRIGQNSTAIQRVNSSVYGVGRDLRQQAVAIRNTRQDVGKLRDLTLFQPLLQRASGGANDQLGFLLPFLLLGGIGGDGKDGGGGLFGGGDSLMTILLLTTVLDGNRSALAPAPANTGGK